MSVHPCGLWSDVNGDADGDSTGARITVAGRSFADLAADLAGLKPYSVAAADVVRLRADYATVDTLR